MLELVISKSAKKFVQKMDQPTKKRLKRTIDKIREVPPVGDITSLKNGEGVLRLRVGTFRILFYQDLINNELVVIDIDNRGDVYKRL